MKITKVETLWHPKFARFVWLQVHTDEGLVGLGEVGHNALAAAEILHAYAQRFLLGAAPLRIDHLWTSIYDAMRIFSPAGSELRALAAIDEALWDILGKATNQPVYQLLGGASRDSIPLYNTCIGQDPVPDYRRFHEDAGELAEELLAEGIDCMKIWPFDPFARQSHGQYLSTADLDRGLAPVRSIRERVEDRMGIAIELHGFWNLPCALQITRALEPYRVQWVEEAISPESIQTQAEFAQASPVPVVSGERIYTRFGLRALLESGGAHIVNPDLTWTGGIGELKRMATMAEAYRRPIKPHNEGGPVHHVACAHVAANRPSLYLLETIRFNYRHVFPQLVEGLPEVVVTEVNDTPTSPLSGAAARVSGARRQARLALPNGPGLGVTLHPALIGSPELQRRVTPQA
ncbi:MAG TPA: mandelate racemase/muconate lactonizing enzyme family protein [Chloroflexota bacterium]|nr:mandelate racemase/muconate lactonizing enzyme family protein [Chloroflexota bacterium]